MENKSVTLAAQVLAPAVSEIRSLLEASRKNVAQQVNQELLSTYWKIGEIVVRCEQNDSIRAAYGEKTLSQLSRALTKELGKGFSRSNVYNMRQFYLSYPIFQTVSGKLSWSHYCELLSISDKEKRSFYEKEAVNSGWRSTTVFSPSKDYRNGWRTISNTTTSLSIKCPGTRIFW